MEFHVFVVVLSGRENDARTVFPLKFPRKFYVVAFLHPFYINAVVLKKTVGANLVIQVRYFQYKFVVGSIRSIQLCPPKHWGTFVFVIANEPTPGFGTYMP